MIDILFSAIFDGLNNLFLMLGYVSNVNSFPQPLNSEEEQHYVEAYRNGNEEARNILIERNLRLVAHIVKKYGSCGSDSDDLISIGTIGLIKAISTFNMDKGTRLATYAARCIENAITPLRKQNTVPITSNCTILSHIGVLRAFIIKCKIRCYPFASFQIL